MAACPHLRPRHPSRDQTGGTASGAGLVEVRSDVLPQNVLKFSRGEAPPSMSVGCHGRHPWKTVPAMRPQAWRTAGRSGGARRPHGEVTAPRRKEPGLARSAPAARSGGRWRHAHPADGSHSFQRIDAAATPSPFQVRRRVGARYLSFVLGWSLRLETIACACSYLAHAPDTDAPWAGRGGSRTARCPPARLRPRSTPTLQSTTHGLLPTTPPSIFEAGLLAVARRHDADQHSDTGILPSGHIAFCRAMSNWKTWRRPLRSRGMLHGTYHGGRQIKPATRRADVGTRARAGGAGSA